jgi:hypothetical protein
MEDKDVQEIHVLKEVINALIERIEKDEDSNTLRTKRKLKNVARLLIEEAKIEGIDSLEKLRPHLTKEGYELLLNILLDE